MIDKRIVIEYAKSQIGYHEKATNAELDDFYANSGSHNWNKYARDLDKLGNWYNGPKNIGDQGHWCDIFVDACFVACYTAPIAMLLLCQPPYSAGAGCMYSAQYYEQQGRFFVTGPQTGDQIFFDYGGGINHTGIVTEVGRDYIKTVEGNSDDQVQECTYQKNAGFIAGYGRPNWEISGGDITPDDPDDQEPEPEPDTVELTISLPVIRYGDESVYVKIMQALLISKGFSCGIYGDDGEYGQQTKIGLYQYQKANGIEPQDCICGQSTWQKLLGGGGG